MTRLERASLNLALSLLREIRVQEFLTDAAWESKELRRWIKKTDALLTCNPKDEPK